MPSTPAVVDTLVHDLLAVPLRRGGRPAAPARWSRRRARPARLGRAPAAPATALEEQQRRQARGDAEWSERKADRGQPMPGVGDEEAHEFFSRLTSVDLPRRRPRRREAKRLGARAALRDRRRRATSGSARSSSRRISTRPSSSSRSARARSRAWSRSEAIRCPCSGRTCATASPRSRSPTSSAWRPGRRAWDWVLLV